MSHASATAMLCPLITNVASSFINAVCSIFSRNVHFILSKKHYVFISEQADWYNETGRGRVADEH